MALSKPPKTSLDKMKPQVLIIAGPTASGKNALALSVAQHLKKTVWILNADSKQVYRELPVLTNQPNAQEKKQCHHLLYGSLSVLQHYSLAQWRSDVLSHIEHGLTQSVLPIIVGGSFLYLKRLTEGITPLPHDREVRHYLTQKLTRYGSSALHRVLCQHDKQAHQSIHPNDAYRTLRALEVLLITGKSIATLHRERPQEKPQHRYHKIALLPTRESLYQQADRRFHQMLDQGAIAEVQHARTLSLSEEHAAWKILGFQAINHYLAGDLSHDEAITKAQQQTRHYIKRQLTWLRHQAGDYQKHTTKNEALSAILQSFR